MDSKRIAVVTGAGSGVGRAVAAALGQRGFVVGLVGRTRSHLDETAALLKANAVVLPFDIADERAVGEMAQRVAGELGPVDVLVNSAGTNVTRRALAEISMEDYRRTMETNMTGTYLCIKAFLPAMKQRGAGLIINIVSDAGIVPSAKAGAIYAASKFAVRGLTQAVLAEERANGIRATAICPGDIDTPLLNRRPVVPTAEQRQRMLRPEDVAACAMLAVDLPEHVVVEEILVRPR